MATRTPNLKALTTAMTLALVLSGCGANPAASKRSFDRPAPTSATGGGWVGAPGIGLPAGAADPGAVDRARKILQAVDAATKGVDNWSAVATSEVVSPSGEKNWNTSQIKFKHPATMAATVVRAKDGKSVNTKLVYRGGNDIQLKTYFFGFIAIKLTLPVDDARLVDCYKRSLRETQTKQLFDTILHPQAEARWIGEGTAAGEAVDWIDVRSPNSWKGVTHEVVGISRRLNLPIARDCYDARDRRIVRLELKGMKLNFAAKPDDFTVD